MCWGLVKIKEVVGNVFVLALSKTPLSFTIDAASQNTCGVYSAFLNYRQFGLGPKVWILWGKKKAEIVLINFLSLELFKTRSHGCRC